MTLFSLSDGKQRSPGHSRGTGDSYKEPDDSKEPQFQKKNIKLLEPTQRIFKKCTT